MIGAILTALGVALVGVGAWVVLGTELVVGEEWLDEEAGDARYAVVTRRRPLLGDRSIECRIRAETREPAWCLDGPGADWSSDDVELLDGPGGALLAIPFRTHPHGNERGVSTAPPRGLHDEIWFVGPATGEVRLRYRLDTVGHATDFAAFARIGDTAYVAWPSVVEGDGEDETPIAEPTLRAIDLDDGSVRWTRPIPTSTCCRQMGTERGAVWLTQSEWSPREWFDPVTGAPIAEPL